MLPLYGGGGYFTNVDVTGDWNPLTMYETVKVWLPRPEDVVGSYMVWIYGSFKY